MSDTIVSAAPRSRFGESAGLIGALSNPSPGAHPDDCLVCAARGETGRACQDAGTIAKDQSEFVVLRSARADQVFSLFAIPIIVEFGCEVPAAVFDYVLANLNWSRELLPRVKAACQSPRQFMLMRSFHRLDDLVTV